MTAPQSANASDWMSGDYSAVRGIVCQEWQKAVVEFGLTPNSVTEAVVSRIINGIDEHFAVARASALPPSGVDRDIKSRILRELSDRRLLNNVDDDLHDEIASALAALLNAPQSDVWRDIGSAPKDGTLIIGAFFSIPWADSHRRDDVVTCWWQPEFDAFISSAREMMMHNGYTFEDGSTRRLHSPVIEPITHWMPFIPPSLPQPSYSRGGGDHA